MYSMIHNLRTGITLREGGALLIAFVIAEVFYKFHSFTLECAAFLATWYALGALASGVDALLGNRRKRPHG
jgi:hypothetical protein